MSIRIGIVGIGFMGMIHYLAGKRLRDAKVTAIATRDPKKRAGDWTSIQGNFGPRGGQEDLSGIAVHADPLELIKDSTVDLVDICLPNDQHADLAIRALEAGKHVLVEKPIALTLPEADRMLAAAKASGKQLLVAQVLPFFAEFRYAYDLSRSGKYGKVIAAHLRRHISPPDWSSSISDLARTGGPIIDLHIHDTHFVGLLAGVPESVFSRGLEKHGTVEYVSTEYLYGPGGPVVSATSGAISHPARPFTHGYEVYFEKATVHYDAASGLTLFAEGGVQKPELPSADPVDSFASEIQYAVDAVTGKGPSELLSGQLARDALALCLREAESVRTGKIIAIG